MDNLVWMPNSLFSSSISLAANCGPRSSIIESGKPWYLHTLSQYSLANPNTLVSDVVGIACICFLAQSTTTRSASNPCALGNPTMKSADIFFHGSVGVLGDMSFPAGGWGKFLYH